MASGFPTPSRRSIRLPGFDYSNAGTYFVSLCADGRRSIFGRITQGQVRLSQCGRLARRCWMELPAHFDNVQLGSFVVMPNHVHGIVLVLGRAGTACRAPTSERFGKPRRGSLPTIVRSFKSAVTRNARRHLGLTGQTIWQRGYFEHVVRNEAALERINAYIASNPETWHIDSENPHREGHDEFEDWLRSFRTRPSNHGRA